MIRWYPSLFGALKFFIFLIFLAIFASKVIDIKVLYSVQRVFQKSQVQHPLTPRNKDVPVNSPQERNEVCQELVFLSYHSYYSNNMVLQKDVKNNVWGYTYCKSNITAMYSCRDEWSTNDVKVSIVSKGIWMLELPPITSSKTCSIYVVQDGFKITLSDVAFGDVWLCSGQSNMEMFMRDIEDAKEEIMKSENYDIRFTMISNVATKSTDTDDFRNMEIEIPWSKSNQVDELKMMSALCYLFARNIQDFMRKEGLTPPPMGLISTEWGGTPVESWLPDAATEKCKSRETNTNMGYQRISGALWKHMVNPLKWNSVKGFLWYQGEANRNRNRDLYQCTFPALIESWREEFSTHSSTDPMAPFGFVQLTQFSTKKDHDWTVIRWHQTADFGYVPNEKMPNTFMGVAPDTYSIKLNDFSGGIHPMDKQTPSLRLAIAGLNIAYGFKNYPTGGPWPSNIVIDALNVAGQKSVIVTYDQPINFNANSSTSGFHVCFMNEFDCDNTRNDVNWEKIDKNNVSLLDDKSVSILILLQEKTKVLTIGYLWEVTPVLKRHDLPIYALDEFKLPSPPWKREIEF